MHVISSIIVYGLPTTTNSSKVENRQRIISLQIKAGFNEMLICYINFHHGSNAVRYFSVEHVKINIQVPKILQQKHKFRIGKALVNFSVEYLY